MIAAFKQVFSDARLQELAVGNRRRGLGVGLYVLPTGKVAEVDFSIDTNSTVTAAEVVQLENAIKNNVYFSITPEDAKNGDFYGIYIEVKYLNILNNIERKKAETNSNHSSNFP